MERALKELCTHNQFLIAKYKSLKKKFAKLMTENQQLNNRLSSIVSCPNCCSQNRFPVGCDGQTGSAEFPLAERSVHTLSSGFANDNSGGGGPMEDCAGFPSLPELLDELNKKVDDESFKQLTQDLAIDLETPAQNTSIDKVSY